MADGERALPDRAQEIIALEAEIDGYLADVYAEVPEGNEVSRALLRAAFGLGYVLCWREKPTGAFGRKHGYDVPQPKTYPPGTKAELVREEPHPAAIQQHREATRPPAWECWACEATISSGVQTCPNCGSPNLDPRGNSYWTARRALGTGRWDNFIDVFTFASALALSDADASEYATEVTGQAGPEAVVV